MPPVFILLRSHWVLQTSISTKALRVSSSSANKNIQNELCWDVLTEVVSRRFGDGFPPVNWITKFKRISPPRLNICIKIGTLVISTVSKFNHFKLVGSKLEEFGSRSQIRGWMMIFQICHTELRQVGEDSAKANTTIIPLILCDSFIHSPLWMMFPPRCNEICPLHFRHLQQVLQKILAIEMPEGGKKTVLIWVVNTNVHCTCLNSMYEYLYIQHGCVKLPKKKKSKHDWIVSRNSWIFLGKASMSYSEPMVGWWPFLIRDS